MAESGLLIRLRRAVQKVKLLLTLDRTKWLLCSLVRSPTGGTRRLSFRTSPPSLLDTLEGDEDNWASVLGSPSSSSGRTSRTVSRATSSGASSDRMSRTTSDATSVEGSTEDINEKAEKFIENFYRQLRMERQVSLELRYCREESLERTRSD